MSGGRRWLGRQFMGWLGAVIAIPLAFSAEPVKKSPLSPPVIEPTTGSSAHGLFRPRYRLADDSFCYAGAAVDPEPDGRRVFFFASRATGLVTRLNAADGQVGWSLPFAGSQQSLSAFDLTGDGTPEILYTTSNPGRLYVLRGNGEVVGQWDSGDSKLGNSPVVLDTEGDGILDGYFGSRSRYLFRLNMRDLTVIERREGWSQCGCHTTALDVDRDGRWDLFAGDGDDISKKGILHRFDPLSLQSVWSVTTNDNASSADPVLVDLNGDGQVEIIKSIDNYGHDDGHDGVLAFSTEGRLLWKAEGLSGEDSPNAADLDGDGQMEIVGMTFGSEVYCLDQQGRIRWKRDLRPEFDDSAHAYLTPILCDLNGDATLEILAMTSGGYFDERTASPGKGNGILFALSPSGEILDRLDLGGPRYFGEAFVCDLDRDGRLELVLSGSGGLDVISLAGLGPDTEYYQRRRCYRRLHVVPWAYSDDYFLHRGVREGVTHLADNLVLARTSGTRMREGRFTTGLLRLPPGCEFRRLHWVADEPSGTTLRVELLDARGQVLLGEIHPGDDLRIREPIQIRFHLRADAAGTSPRLDSYTLAFDRWHGTPVESRRAPP